MASESILRMVWILSVAGLLVIGVSAEPEFDGRLDQLEALVKNQGEFLSTLISENVKLTRTTEDMKIENVKMSQTAKEMKSEIIKLTQTGDELQSGNVKLTRTVDEVKNENVQLTRNIEELRQQIQSETSSTGFVAFTVRRTSDWGPVSVRFPIEYDIVELNIGGGWDEISYIFTAPVSGIYHFDYAHEGGITFLMINDDTRQETYIEPNSAGSETNTGSNSANVKLLQNDQVHVELYANNVSSMRCQSDGDECQFPGFLVHETI